MLTLLSVFFVCLSCLIIFFNISFFLFFYLFIYGCVGSSFLCEGFLQLWQVGATLHRGVQAPHRQGLSLRSTGSRRAGSAVAVHGPKPLRSMWDPPRPGPEPTSPALAGRLSTTAPPGKPNISFITIFVDNFHKISTHILFRFLQLIIFHNF